MADLLTLTQVSKSFGAIVIAERLDFRVARGEAVGILGPNGAGKSTLLGLITGTLPPDAGRVEFDGQDISRLPAHRRCQLGIGRAFQVPQPFGDMTVFENLVVAASFGAGNSARASTSIEMSSLSPRARRKDPARPIMAALSVQSSNLGTMKSTPRLWHSNERA